MDTAELLLMLAFTLPISFLPGPNNLLSAAHSSQHGFRNTLPLILGGVGLVALLILKKGKK